jgi:hypothetical protein
MLFLAAAIAATVYETIFLKINFKSYQAAASLSNLFRN